MTCASIKLAAKINMVYCRIAFGDAIQYSKQWTFINNNFSMVEWGTAICTDVTEYMYIWSICNACKLATIQTKGFRSQIVNSGKCNDMVAFSSRRRCQ